MRWTTADPRRPEGGEWATVCKSAARGGVKKMQGYREVREGDKADGEGYAKSNISVTYIWSFAARAKKEQWESRARRPSDLAGVKVIARCIV